MSDQLFIVLRVCLLALVYLVFLRVLRAVWVELRAESTVPVGAPASAAPSRPRAPARAPAAPASAPASTMVASAASRLVVIAPATLAGHGFSLTGETTIGRGAGCGVSIDDAHVSKLHARLSPRDGGWLLEDLGSTNGTMLNGAPLTAATPIATGGRITIGEIVLELA